MMLTTSAEAMVNRTASTQIGCPSMERMRLGTNAEAQRKT
jgi:hypothetical protein